MFLAQAYSSPILTTPSPPEAIFFYLFIASLSFLLMTSVAIVTLIVMLRRKPSIESEFATKQELHTESARLSHELHAEVGRLSRELHTEVERLGQGINSLDDRNEERSKAIFQKLDAIVGSFDHGMREVHRAIGRLEGNPS
jgi:hypothetical protein